MVCGGRRSEKHERAGVVYGGFLGSTEQTWRSTKLDDDVDNGPRGYGWLCRWVSGHAAMWVDGWMGWMSRRMGGWRGFLVDSTNDVDEGGGQTADTRQVDVCVSLACRVCKSEAGFPTLGSGRRRHGSHSHHRGVLLWYDGSLTRKKRSPKPGHGLGTWQSADEAGSLH